MSAFTTRWEKENTENLSSKIKNSIRAPPPIRPRIEQASKQIQLQIAKLDANSAKLRDKEAYLFKEVVSSIQKREKQHANMLANELAEVRKMNRMITSAKLALEQITLRLSTIQDLGDVTAMLSPTMGVIRGVRSQLTGVVPEAQNEIGGISDLLSGILSDAGNMSPTTINFESADAEAEKILAEAGVMAENGMRQKFPDLPATEEIADNATEESLS